MELTAIVSVKSTSSAPTGRKAQPSPNAADSPSALSPPPGKRSMSWW